MNRKCTTNETFARMKNRNEQKALFKKLQQLQKEKISVLDDIFRQKTCLKRQRTIYESSTGNSLSEETTHHKWREMGNGRQMNYFSRWILFVNDSSQSLPQQEQLNFHQIRQNRLWVMWESRRCNSAPALTNQTRTFRGRDKGHLPDRSLRTASGKHRRWIDPNKIPSKDVKHNDCSKHSSVSCSQQSSLLKTSKMTTEILGLVSRKVVNRDGIGEKFKTTPGSKKPVDKRIDGKIETKEDLLQPTEDNIFIQTPIDDVVKDSNSKISERQTNGDRLQEDDWSDYGLKLLFRESAENSLNFQTRDRQIKLSTTGNTWIRLKQKRVTPKSVLCAARDDTPSPSWKTEQELNVENSAQRAQDKMFDDRISSDKSESHFVYHRGCKIHGYIKPQERHRVDPLRVEWSGQLLTKVQRHQDYAQRGSSFPRMVFAKPARVKALERLVRENQITRRQRVRNNFQQTILDSKVKSFVTKVEVFSRSSTEVPCLAE